MTGHFNIGLVGRLMAACALVWPTIVAAQEGSEASDPEAQLESDNVIVVTALKRSESVTEVPAAISVFDGDALNALGIDDPVDLAAQTPGLVTTLNSVGAPSFSIRGVGLEDYIGNNTSGTALYIDEIYPVSAAMQNGRLFDVERIEVLKGPQGTLYGRNSTGGAINIITAKPTDYFTGYANVSLNSLDELSMTAAVSGPLSETVQTRLALAYDRGLDAWQEGVGDSAEAGRLDRLAGRFHLQVLPSEALTIQLTVNGELDNGINPSWQADDRTGFDGFLGIQFSSPQEPDRIDLGGFFAGVDGTVAPENDNHQWGGTLRLEYETGIGDLTAITGYQNFKRDAYDNNDGSPATLADFRFRTDVEQFSQELRLTSDIGDFGSLILGGVYSYDTIDLNDVVLITDTLNILSPPGFRPSDFGIEVTQTTSSRQTTRTFGAYAHSEWDLLDDLTVTLAGRYTREKREFEGNVFDDTGYIIGGTGGIIVEDLDSRTETDFSWRVGAEYRATRRTMLYGSIATGFKSGVYFAGPVPDGSAWGYVEPEELTAYEAGLKTELFDFAQFNLAIFHYDYSDKQSSLFIDTVFGPVATLGNVTSSRAHGAEAELSLVPSDAFRFVLGVGVLDAEIQEIDSVVRGSPLASVVSPGDTLTQSPAFTLNMASTITQPLSQDLTGSLQLTYAYTGEMVQFLSDPLSRSEDIHDIGARISIENASSGFTVSLFGSNLLNDDRRTFGYGNLLGNRTFALQRPRVIGVQISFER